MKKHLTKWRLTVIMLVTTLLFSGCSVRRDPPSAEDVKEFLMQNREDIEIVANYLKELECESAFISKDNGTIFYEFDDHEVSSSELLSSIRNLWRAGCTRIVKNDRQGANAIYFEIWFTTIEDADCGIACTINGEGTPETEFQVHYETIDEGWFYCYNNYEKYRVLHRNTG